MARREEKIEIYGLSTDGVAYAEAQGLANCWGAYAEECAGEYIMEVGFNNNSGYVYIALENGVSICSMLGRGVEFLVTDSESGEEYFFDGYDLAIDQLEAFWPPYDED